MVWEIWDQDGESVLDYENGKVRWGEAGGKGCESGKKGLHGDGLGQQI